MFGKRQVTFRSSVDISMKFLQRSKNNQAFGRRFPTDLNSSSHDLSGTFRLVPIFSEGLLYGLILINVAPLALFYAAKRRRNRIVF